LSTGVLKPGVFEDLNLSQATNSNRLAIRKVCPHAAKANNPLFGGSRATRPYIHHNQAWHARCVLQAFLANVQAVHGEEGCIEYDPVIDCPTIGPFQTEFGPDTFAVVEKWLPRGAHAHAAAPHMKAYAAKTGDMIERRAIHVLSPL
jgi:quinol monooxygenase YgiN